jgi:hypothetical protein
MVVDDGIFGGAQDAIPTPPTWGRWWPPIMAYLGTDHHRIISIDSFPSLQLSSAQ